MPFISLLILVALAHFCIDVNLSIWPVFKTMWHLDITWAGILYGVTVIIGEFLQLFFGALISRGYQRQLFVLGLLLGSAPLFLPYVHGYPFFFIALLLTGIGSAAFHPTSASLLGEITGHHKAFALGVFQMCGNAGMAVGQISFVAVYAWLQGQTYLLIFPILILITIGLFSKQLQPNVLHHREPVYLRDCFRFFKTVPLRNLYFVQLLCQAVFWGFVFLLPDLLLYKGYPDAIVYGGGNCSFFLGAAFGCVPAGYLKRFFPASKLITACIACSFVLFYCILFIPLPVKAFMVVQFCFGGFIGAIMPLALDLGIFFVPHKKGMISAFLMGLVWMISEGLGVGTISLLTNVFASHAIIKSLALFGLTLIGAYQCAKKLSKYEQSGYTFN